MPLPDFQSLVGGVTPVAAGGYPKDRTRLGGFAPRLGKRLAQWLVLLALCAWPLAEIASAEQVTNNPLPQTEAPSPILLQATIQNGEIVGFEQLRRVFINTGARRAVFLVPSEYYVNVSDPKKIVLFKSDLTSTFTLRILETEAAPGPNGLSVECCRAWVTNRFEDVTISEELTISSSGGTGPAFDLICKQDRVTRNVRLGFAVTPVGLLECELSATPEHFAAAKTMMRILLRSLQISDAQGILPLQVFRGDN